MRKITPAPRLASILPRFFRVPVSLVVLVAFVQVAMNTEFADSQVIDVPKESSSVANGKNTAADTEKSPTQTGKDQVALGGSGVRCPEKLPGYRQATYDRIAWLVTHNAMSNRVEGWWFPNQSYGITRQLEDGVRGLMLDVHMIDGEAFLLHGSSIFGKVPLETCLAEIKAFMQQHSDVILTLILECYAPATKVRESLEKAGLLSMMHHQDSADAWPKVNDMIKEDKRLVVLTDAGGGEWRGYHDVWEFCQETHYSVKQVADFTYKRNRGNQANSLFILNHFLTRPVAGKVLAARANDSSVLQPRIEGCQSATMRFPNFVVVDFYECGDTLASLADFNQKWIGKQKQKSQHSRHESASALEK